HTTFSRDWSSDVCSSDLKGRLNPCSRRQLLFLNMGFAQAIQSPAQQYCREGQANDQSQPKALGALKPLNLVRVAQKKRAGEADQPIGGKGNVHNGTGVFVGPQRTGAGGLDGVGELEQGRDQQ